MIGTLAARPLALCPARCYTAIRGQSAKELAPTPCAEDRATIARERPGGIDHGGKRAGIPTQAAPESQGPASHDPDPDPVLVRKPGEAGMGDGRGPGGNPGHGPPTHG